MPSMAASESPYKRVVVSNEQDQVSQLSRKQSTVRRKSVLEHQHDLNVDHTTTNDATDHEIARIFRSIDVDNSGAIVKTELSSALTKFGISTHQIDLILNASDENHDGTINFEEFLHIWKKLSSSVEKASNHSPEKPKSEKSSRRLFRKREMAILSEMNLSRTVATKAIDDVNVITEDFSEASDTSSAQHEKHVLNYANTLYKKTTTSVSSKVREKVPLRKPKQLSGVAPSTFSVQCREMRTETHTILYEKAVKTILRLRKFKEEDFEVAMLQKLEGSATAYRKTVNQSAVANVKKWMSSAIQNTVSM